MRRTIASSSLVLAFSLYILFGLPDPETNAAAQAPQPKPVSARAPIPVIALTPIPTPVSPPSAQSKKKTVSAAVPPPKPQPIPAPKSAGQYKDGSYIGPAVDAFYGAVQVKAVVQNGRLANVQFLQYPQDQQTSASVSGGAIPILVSEAIRAQNANVDVVSGATQISEAFRISLANALAAAH